MPATSEPLGAVASSRSVSRLRKHDAANDSTASLASRTSSLGDDSADNMRSSMDNAIDKVRERTRKSVDERRGSDDSVSGKRLSALLDRGARRLKRKEKNNNGASTLGVNHSGDSGELAFSDGRSEGSLLDEDGNSSLLTDDGLDNDGKPLRPTLSPHQSHAAFLTLSSPQLQAQSTQRTSAPDIKQVVPGDPIGTLATNDSTSSLPQIIEPLEDSSPTTKGTAKRNRIRNASPSPADKLRAGFARNRRKSSESAASGVEGESKSLGGIGGLFKKPRSRRSSISSPDPATEKAQESSSIQANPADSVSAVQPSTDTVTAPETPPPAAVRPIEDKTGTPKEIPLRGRINTTSSLPETPPGRPETPTTLVTPPTPTDPSNSTFSRFTSPGTKQSPSKPLSSVESIRHRRAQSQTLPSKLSNAIPAPLTPTLEETKTPGGTLTQPTTATGFFSSVFNVAQKAADQLSATVNTGQKNKPAAVITTEAGSEGVASGTGENGQDTPTQTAFETFGKSDSQVKPPSMSSTTDLLRQQDETNGGPQTNKMEEDAAARAVSVAYEKPVATAVSQATGARPLSIASQDHLTLNGDQAPPEGEGMKRSGSVRSKISGRRRRHRENSTATTNTNATAVNSIAAALKDSASGFSSAANTTGPGHRLTGFAVASSKRNKDFHQLFRSVPEDDYLIEDYSAALQKEILLHGRLYVSEGHICFSSNIFGWVTNLVISFDEVVSVEKKNTAVVFPNAIVIQTQHARNTFASFVARDSTYELLIGIWKINHPKLKSTLNGMAHDNVGESDKTEKAGSIASQDDSDDGSEDEVYDEDDDDDDFGSYTEPDATRSIAGSDVGEPILSRKTSAQPLAAAQLNGNISRTMDAAEAAAAGLPPGGDFPGPNSHGPTECTDTAEHYDRPLTDTTIPAPLGKVYSLMFGAASGTFMKKWLVDEQKSRELDLNDDKIGLDNDHKSFTFSYIKPLNAPVGPKQTKCITTNTLEAFDLEKAVTVNCSTQTPDVPSGSIFTTKTKYCLMWGPGNTTRMIANCTIEWTGKSWLRGPIESGAQGGQTQYIKDITAAITAAVSTKPPGKCGPAGRKGKRKGKKEASDDSAASEQRVTATAVKEPNWGLFEPLRGPLDPFVSLLRPFFTSQVIIAVLFSLLMYSWFFSSRSASLRSGVGFTGSAPERFAAYEELWRREESELWDWLEDRVGLEGMYAPKVDGRQKVLAEKEMGRRLESEGMKGRQVDDAIRVTEERLGALKGAVEREKEKSVKT